MTIFTVRSFVPPCQHAMCQIQSTDPIWHIPQRYCYDHVKANNVSTLGPLSTYMAVQIGDITQPGKGNRHGCSPVDSDSFPLTTNASIRYTCVLCGLRIDFVPNTEARSLVHGTCHPGSMDLLPLTRHVKLRVVHASGMPGTFSPPPRVSDPDLHHGTCVIANKSVARKTSPAFPAQAQPAILRIQ